MDLKTQNDGELRVEAVLSSGKSVRPPRTQPIRNSGKCD